MKEKREDTFYLFTLVNISEDSGLNGEYENKLFRTYTQARQFMESCIKMKCLFRRVKIIVQECWKELAITWQIYG